MSNKELPERLWRIHDKRELYLHTDMDGRNTYKWVDNPLGYCYDAHLTVKHGAYTSKDPKDNWPDER